MIYCPNCNEEIDDDSRFCDQCGQALSFCKVCGKVGKGRRCTSCGGLMVSAAEMASSHSSATLLTSASFVTNANTNRSLGISQTNRNFQVQSLLLVNSELNIRVNLINGAIIGRRQGQYRQVFANFGYVSGVHAQFFNRPDMGWCIADKHSSNGTFVNKMRLEPDVAVPIKVGDIIDIANVPLTVMG